MPYDDKQVLRGKDGNLYQYDAAANDWNPWTTPKSPDDSPYQWDEAAGHANPFAGANAAAAGSVAADMSKGAYQGTADFGTGTLGLPGDVANWTRQKVTGTDEAPYPGSDTMRRNLRGMESMLYGGPIPSPESKVGDYTRTVASMAPAMLMPGMGTRTLGGRFLENVVAPAVGSEAAGQLSNDNPYARFGGAMLASRSLNPLGGSSRKITGEALKAIGTKRENTLSDSARGNSFFDKSGNKTVLDARDRQLSNIYQSRENAYLADPSRTKAEIDAYNALGNRTLQNEFLTKNYTGVNPKGQTWADTDRQYAILHALYPLAGKSKTGRFLPEDVRDAVKDQSSRLHNQASKLAPSSTAEGGKAASVAALLGLGLGHAVPGLLGHPELSHIGAYGSALGAGGVAGGLALRFPNIANKLNTRTLEGVFGNDPRRTLAGSVIYKNPEISDNQ
jgi:hypothetical protein